MTQFDADLIERLRTIAIWPPKLRRINLDSALKRVSERLNLRGRAIVCPYAEVGMDVDKPHQLEIMRADLQKRVTT